MTIYKTKYRPIQSYTDNTKDTHYFNLVDNLILKVENYKKNKKLYVFLYAYIKDMNKDMNNVYNICSVYYVFFDKEGVEEFMDDLHNFKSNVDTIRDFYMSLSSKYQANDLNEE